MKKILSVFAILMMSMAIPQSVKAYDFSAVAPSGQTLYYNIVDGEAQVTYQNSYSPRYTYLSGALVIPNTVTYNSTTYSVTSIGDYAFRGCSGLTSVTIPNSVTSIGYYAFFYCSGLNSIVVSSGNTHYDSRDNCNAIVETSTNTLIAGCQNTVIPNSVTSIGYLAFAGCSGLTSVTIPNSVTSIGSNAFNGCSGLTSVTIPNSVTSIGNSAFRNCSGLTSVTIPNSVTSIGDYVFYGCSGLTSVTIPNSVTYIGDYAFRGCSVLTEVTMLSEIAPTLGSYVFYGNGSSRIINIPCGSYDSYYNGSGWFDYRAALHEKFMEYALTIGSSDSVKGIANGGDVACDSSAIIRATPNYGYYFDHWSNGNTANPDTLHLVGDSTVTAIFAPNQYIVNGVVNDDARGHVSGSDTVDYLDTVTLTATANYGYHFVRWNDNNTENPRSIAATCNITKTAFFEYDQYSLLVQADTSIHGYCNGGGNYNYLSERTILANANYGYHFMAWNDGDTNNPRTITLTQDTIFTAYYAPNQYSILGQTNDSVTGVVEGSAIVDYLDSVTLEAIPNYGYHFVRWNDNNTDNPRTVQVMANANYTAYFDYDQFILTVQSDNTIQGYVSGGGSYDYLSNRTITATPNYGYHFTYWNDGVVENPRTITLTQDTSFTAHFAPNQYTLTVTAGEHGTASGSGTYDYGDTIVIQAYPEEHYHFTRWNDGNTSNPRQYRIEEDKTLTAFFAIDTHTVSVVSSDIARGMVETTGTEFGYGTPCTVTATAYTGYTFAGWSNGVTANPYTFAVLSDVELTALFIAEGEEVYTVNVESANPTMGTVSGGGQAFDGGSVVIRAAGNPGYHFTQWDDGNTDSVRTVVVHGNVTYTAYFASDSGNEGIGEPQNRDDISVFVLNRSICVSGANGLRMCVFSVDGRLVAKRNNTTGQESIPVTTDGVYFVKVGNHPARKVVVIR